jgi:hypothetical protein
MKIDKYQSPDQYGAILGMPNEVYHDHPSAVSNTRLKTFHDSPLDYEALHVTKTRQKAQKACFNLGSGAHSLSLEGVEQFDTEFAVLPQLDWRSKSGKIHAAITLNSLLDDPLPQPAVEEIAQGKREEIEQAFAGSPGRTPITQDQWQSIRAIRDGIRNDEDAQKLLSSGYPELTFRVECEMFPMQCRCDWFNADGKRPHIVDLKTIARLDQWGRQFETLAYYRAWAFYAKTIELVTDIPCREIDFYWIVAESDFPYRVQVVKADRDWFELGMAEVSQDIVALNQMMAEGFHDPGVGGIKMMDSPRRWLIERDTRPGVQIRGTEGGAA